MYVVIVNLRVKPGSLEAFRTAVQDNAHATRQEEGCLRFDVLQDTQDSHTFVLYEIYRDQDAFFIEHRQAPHYPAWRAASTEHLVPGGHRNTYCSPLVPADLPEEP